MQKELLVPVGNFACLPYAVFNGCDAIYLAGKKYGARAYADNFTDEELKKAVSFCHLYGVKVYVAINVMLFERELNAVLEYLHFLVSINVDALIVSDLGLIATIHELYPNLEIHASTQAHTFNVSQIKFLKELGVKRVVVDRELSLKEIKKLENIIDIEVFIHGALCVSYSGNCLMSYMLKQRSGNRGCCAQVCRLKYSLEHKRKIVPLKDKYLLSTKELNTSAHLDELLASKIVSFKVEGRMKSPSYVGFITKYYRTLITNYEKTGKVQIKKEDIEKLKVIFNREFTDGYLFESKNIYNMKTPNHQGTFLGQVISISKDKIKIKLKKSLSQGDGIRFISEDVGMMVNYLYDKNGKLINMGRANDIVYVLNKVNLTKTGEVRKTIDYQLETELSKVAKKKILVNVDLNISLGKFAILVDDGNNKIKLVDDFVFMATKKATTKEEIIKQIKKTGNTPFEIDKISICIEPNLFIPLSKINDIRRRVLEMLERQRRK